MVEMEIIHLSLKKCSHITSRFRLYVDPGVRSGKSWLEENILHNNRVIISVLSRTRLYVMLENMYLKQQGKCLLKHTKASLISTLVSVCCPNPF